MRTVVGTDDSSLLTRWPVDALFELYVSWREECHTVWKAYGSWADAGGPRQRKLAYAAYLAALDREEQAARAYADQSDRVSRIGS
jgi:hypothetical protein